LTARLQIREKFTFIELVIIFAIVTIIVAAAFVAIDPARRLHTARNTNRLEDVSSILNSITKYRNDNDGVLPSTPIAIDSNPNTFQLIGKNIGDCESATCSVLKAKQISTSDCEVTGLYRDIQPYIVNIPKDPKASNEDNTRYYINKDSNGFITIGACDVEPEGAGGTGIKPKIEVTEK